MFRKKKTSSLKGLARVRALGRAIDEEKPFKERYYYALSDADVVQAIIELDDKKSDKRRKKK